MIVGDLRGSSSRKKRATNTIARSLLETFTQLNEEQANEGDVNTYRKGSIIDLPRTKIDKNDKIYLTGMDEPPTARGSSSNLLHHQSISRVHT